MLDLKRGIRTPEQLREALQLAISAKDKTDVIWAIHKYKWYNWYLNLHIKPDSPADEENTLIFKEIQEKYPKIHELIEDNIKYEVKKMNGDFD